MPTISAVLRPHHHEREEERGAADHGDHGNGW
jgi:hypothetical protein